MSISPAALEVDRLRVAYGGVVALDGVSLQAHAGRITAVLGPNGAGKTSLLETAQGLRRATAGAIRVLGRDHRRLERRDRARIGVMLQDGGLPPAMTALAAVRDRARLFRDPLDPDALLTEVGLDPRSRTRIRALSGGEQRRVALALALVGRPSLVFLDEPAAGLDPHGRDLMAGLLDRVRRSGVAVVLTTHLLEDLERIADRVVILHQGAVVADGTIEELTHDHDEAISFAGPLHLDLDGLLRALPAGSSAREVSPGRYVVGAPDGVVDPATLATVAAWGAQHEVLPRDLQVGRRTLADVYRTLTAEA